MSITSPQNPGRALIHRAAEGGLFFGLYLSALAYTSGATVTGLSIMAWVSNGLTIGIPFFIYALLRKSYAETDFKTIFSEVWAEGIAIFFLGSAIQAVAIYLGLRYIAPDLLSQLAEQFAATFAQADITMSADMTSALHILRHLSPTDVIAQIMSMNLIGGMVLSLLLAILLVARYANDDRRRRYLQKHSPNANGH